MTITSAELLIGVAALLLFFTVGSGYALRRALQEAGAKRQDPTASRATTTEPAALASIIRTSDQVADATERLRKLEEDIRAVSDKLDQAGLANTEQPDETLKTAADDRILGTISDIATTRPRFASHGVMTGILVQPSVAPNIFTGMRVEVSPKGEETSDPPTTPAKPVERNS